ncbi:MAG: hypothetical protein JWR07_3591 [Nevskia sp.]|nr:hypothetical protein [Nevskia sp.]
MHWSGCSTIYRHSPPPDRQIRLTGKTKEEAMLHYAVVFLIIALIAGALGFFGIAGTAASIAKILFLIFLVLFAVSLIAGRRPTV